MATNRRTWEGTDPRDQAFDRTFTLFALDEIDSIRGGHTSIVILLAVPDDRLEKAVIVDRQHSTDPRRDARLLVQMVNGGDGPDRDRARNLRTRIALARRDHAANVELRVGVHYGRQLPARDEKPEQPTDQMLERIRHELEHETGMGGFRWRTALAISDLPETPHDRMVLALVGIDARGRVHDSLVRPNHHALDRWHRRNLPALVQAVMAHPTFKETIDYCEARGLAPLFLWRPERRERAVA